MTRVDCIQRLFARFGINLFCGLAFFLLQNIASADTLDFDAPKYKSEKRLDAQDGWIFNANGKSGHADDFKIHKNPGHNDSRFLRAHTHGQTEYSRKVSPQSGVVELKWRWMAPQDEAELCFGPSDSLIPGQSNWQAFRVKVCFDEIGFSQRPHRANCGKQHENSGGHEWHDWNYMRLRLDLAGGRYSLFRDRRVQRDDEDTLIVNGSISGMGPVSRIFFKAGGRSPYVDVDDIEWVGVGGPPPPPLTLTITTPSKDTLVNRTPIIVSYTVNGALFFKQVALAEGPNAIIVDTVDTFGRRSADTVNITLDTQSLLVVITSPTEGFNTNQSTISVSWTVDGVVQSTGNTQVLTKEGNNTVVRSATDAAGNVGVDSVHVIRDTQAPIVAITYPPTGHLTRMDSIAVGWTVDGIPQTMETMEYLGVEGSNTITRRFTDAAGNPGVASVVVIRDTQSPVVVITSPANGFITEQTTVPVVWNVDGFPQVLQTSQNLVLGVNPIIRSATDAAGNTGSDSIVVTRTAVQAVPPTVTIISPVEGFVTDARTVPVQWTANGIAQPAGLDTLVEGINTVTRAFTDTNGLTGTASVRVIRNSVPWDFRAFAQTSPSNGGSPLAVTFRGWGNSPYGLRWHRWDFNGDGVADTAISVPPDSVTFRLDDFESGLQGWVPGGTAGTLTLAHGGERSNGSASNRLWSTNASPSYTDYMDAWIASPPVSIPAASACTLSWRQNFDSEWGYDYGLVEIDEGSGSFSALKTYNGTLGESAESVDLTAYAGTTIRLRFRFISDGSVVYQGWKIDNVAVLADQNGTVQTLFSDSANGSVTWDKNASGQQWALIDDPNGPAIGKGTYWIESDTSTYSYPGGMNAWITSPTIQLEDSSRFILSYWQYMGVVDENDGGWIEISENNGPFGRLQPLGGGYPGYIGGFGPGFTGHRGAESPQFDLSPHAGQSIRIRFRFVSTNPGSDRGWLIDSVRIAEVVGGLGTGISTVIHVYETPGDYQAIFKVVDYSGNEAQADPFTTLVKVGAAGAPSLAITSPKHGSATNQTLIPIAWTVNGVSQSTQNSETLLSEGTNIVTRSITDSLGNSSSASIQVIRDTEPPGIYVYYPYDGLVVNQSQIYVYGVRESGSFFYYVDLHTGDNTIVVSDTDAVGNVNSVTMNVTLDVTPPVVSIVSPAQDTTVMAPSVWVQYMVDGELLSQSYALTLGQNEIIVYGYDAPGNVGMDTIYVTREPKVLNVVITSPAEGDTVLGSSVLVHYTVEGVARDPVEYEVRPGDNELVVEANEDGDMGRDTVHVFGKGCFSVLNRTALFDFPDSLACMVVGSGGVVHATQRLRVDTLLIQEGGLLLTDDTLEVVSGVVDSGGVISHSEFNSTDTSKRVYISAISLTLRQGSKIDVSGKGYPTGMGPGWRSSEFVSGGSHSSSGYNSIFSGYGDFQHPELAGSGAGQIGYDYYAGSGGGVVRIEAQSLTLDGSIQAVGSVKPYGTGAGGSVWVTAQAFQGSGFISAAAGAGDYMGSGGRIAVYSDSIPSTFVQNVSAKGYGGGTIYLEDARGYRELRIDTGFGGVTQAPVGLSDSTLSVSLALNSKTVFSGDTRLKDVIGVGVADATVAGKLQAYRLIQNGGTWEVSDTVRIDSVLLEGASVLTHKAGVGDSTWKLHLISSYVHLASGAAIDVTGKGFPAGVGPYGQRNISFVAGGTHAGVGINANISPYGNYWRPEMAGGGSGNFGYDYYGGAGGGIVRINSRTISLDGAIRADGSQKVYTSGAGGSIWLSGDTLIGSGRVSAAGGQGDYPGGGGRVAVYSCGLSQEFRDSIGVGGFANGSVYLPCYDNPIVEITSPVNGAIIYSGVIPVRWMADGQSVSTDTTAALVEGFNQITRCYTSPHGFSGCDTVTVRFDPNPPRVEILSPANGSYTTQYSIPVSWSIDGVVQTTQVTQTLPDEGVNRIIRSFTDSAGSFGADTVYVTKDTKLPIITLIHPGQSGIVLGSDANIRWAIDSVEQPPIHHVMDTSQANMIVLRATDSAGNSDSLYAFFYSGTRVPNLIGLNFSKAESLLTRVPLTPETTWVDNDTLPTGVVFEQTPNAGDSIRFHFPVRYKISRGLDAVDLVPQAVNVDSMTVDPLTLVAGGKVRVVTVNVGRAAVNDSFGIVVFEDRNRDQKFTGEDLLLGRGTSAGAILQGDSSILNITVSGPLTFNGNRIGVEVDYSSLIAEVHEDNNFTNSMANCRKLPDAVDFMPEVLWEWKEINPSYGAKSVYTMPLVLQWNDDNGDGKVDGKDMPDVIVSTFLAGVNDAIKVLDGKDGHVIFDYPLETGSVLDPFVQPAVGDLDGDRRPELVFVQRNFGQRQFVILGNEGAVKGKSPRGIPDPRAVLLGDLDADGKAEIIYGPLIYNHHGDFVAFAEATDPVNTPFHRVLPVDMDGDGYQELVGSNSVGEGRPANLNMRFPLYSFKDRTPINRNAGFLPTLGSYQPIHMVAGVDSGREPGIISTRSIRERMGAADVFDFFLTPKALYGGVAFDTIQPLDQSQPVSNHEAFYGKDSSRFYYQIGSTGFCCFPGGATRFPIPYFSKTNFSDSSVDYALDYDPSSFEVNGTVFDLDGDGSPEVILTNQDTLYIFDSKGNVLSALKTPYHVGGTNSIVVADVNNDGHADLVHGLGNPDWQTGGGPAVMVYTNPTWVGARGIYNQEYYTVTNINDDGSIPRFPTPHWQSNNTVNIQCTAGNYACVDISASYPQITVTDSGRKAITARIGNGGALELPSGIPVSLFTSRGGIESRLATFYSPNRLKPGEYYTLTSVLPDSLRGRITFRIAADDSGNGQGQLDESSEPNNSVSLTFLLNNQNPVITAPANQYAQSGIGFLLPISAADPDGDTLKYALTKGPVGMVIDSLTGVITWLPSQNVPRCTVIVAAFDSYEGTASATFLVYVDDGSNQPPQITSTPGVVALLNTLNMPIGYVYRYTIQATDPEGGVLEYEARCLNCDGKPPGRPQLESNQITWIPFSPIWTAGDSVVMEVRAIDIRGAVDSQTFAIRLENVSTPGNHNPRITTLPPATAVAGSLYEYAVNAVDEDGNNLSYFLAYGPTGMNAGNVMDVFTITNRGQVSWQVPQNAASPVSVEIFVLDGNGGEARQTWQIAVVADDVPPGVSIAFSHNPVRPGESVTVTLAATDNVGVSSTSLRLNGNPVTLSGGQYSFTPSDSGSYTFLGQATDADGNTGVATALLRVTPDADNSPPTVSLSHAPQNPQAGQTVTFTVTASDDVALDSERLWVMVDGLTLPVQGGQAEYQALRPGNFTAKAAAYDSQGNSALAFDALSVTPIGGDTIAPTANITQPEDDFVAYGKVELTGTAHDANLAYYTLSHRDINTQNFVEYHRSTTNVQNGMLGFVDATTLLNGDYEIRLDVYDRAGNAKSHSIQVQAAGEKKVGNFSLAFQDLSVPLAGLDLSVTRTYDSRDKRKGDFGIGWTMGMRSISLHENRNQGIEWNISRTAGFVPQYSVTGNKPHTVTVTLPGGRKQEFDATPQFFSPFDPSQGTMEYRGRPGTYSSLEGLDASYFLVMGGELYDPDGDLQTTFDPQRYKLTLLDGSYFIYDQDAGGVTETGDANGNTVAWEGNAIRHSTGGGIQFTRDAESRITAINDGGRTLQYRYDVLGNLREVTDANGNPTKFKYGPNSYLNEIIDARGVRATRTEYDDEGRVIRQINADGDTLKMAHNLDQNIEEVEDFKGQVTTYSYDLHGNVLSKTDDANNTWFYSYDSADNILSTTLPGGITKSSTYDGKGNELTSTDELGHTTTRTYNALGKVLTSTDPLSRTTRYEYDEVGNLTKEIGPNNAVQSERTIDNQGNVLAEKDALGNTTTHVYRSNGWLRYTTDPLGRTTSFGYYPLTGEVAEEVDAKGNRTSYAHDKNGNRIVEVNAHGDSTRTEYNSINKVVRQTDALGNVTRYVYNNLGDKVADIAADGATVSRVYDPLGNMVSTSDPVGRTTRMEYDHENRVTRTVFNDSSFVRSEYDALGRRLRSFDANGNLTQYGYDDAGRNTTVTDAYGHVTRYEYDDVGRKTAMVDALNQRTEYGYDAYDRLITNTFHDGTIKSTGYDAAGRKVSETDQAGKTTGFEYDDAGNLMAVVDALNHRTEYSYDANNNRLTQKDANNHTTSMAYDDLNRMVSRTYPNGDQERWHHDPNGNATSYVKGTDSTAYQFDAMSREAFRKHFPSGHEVRTTYTADGNQDSVIDYRGLTRFLYDNRGRLAAEGMPNGDFVESDYDAQGNRVRMMTPFDTTRYTFDALNRMDSVIASNGATMYRYNVVGNRDSVQNPNGTAIGYFYDNLNRLTEVRNWSGESLLSRFTYTLNDAGLRTAVDELGGGRVEYGYDDLYRLTSEVRTGSNAYSITYTYDDVGNRLTQVKGGVATTYTYNYRNQLTVESSSAGTITYSYDAAGRQTSKTDSVGTTVMTYVDGDRLASVVGPGVNVSYQYDAEGQRVQETAGGQTKQYLIDPTLPYGQVVLETDGAGNLTGTYAYGLERISQTRAGVTHFYLADGQGSIRQLTDTTGEVTDTWLYFAFGEILQRTGTTDQRFTYTGEEFDPNAQLVYLRARWMDPKTGRFTAVDPYSGDQETPATLHRYVYANSSPISFVDRNGMQYTYGSLAVGGVWAGVYQTISLTAARSYLPLIAKAVATVGVAIAASVAVGEIIEGVDKEIPVEHAGAAISAIALMVQYFEKFRDSPEFRNRSGNHWAEVMAFSLPNNTAKVMDWERKIGKLTVSKYSGGKGGRLLQLKYGIGRNANFGQGLFLFRADYMNFEATPPALGYHLHVRFGNTNIDHQEF